jgi:hypothetical protein
MNGLEILNMRETKVSMRRFFFPPGGMILNVAGEDIFP